MSIVEASGPAIFRGEDYTGRVIGGYEVLGLAGKKYYSEQSWHYIWWARCVTCDNTVMRQSQHIRNSKLGCDSCKGALQSGTNSVHWKGGRYVSGYFLAKTKTKLTRGSRTIEWGLDASYLDEVWLRQDGKCAYTGWELTIGNSKTEQTASLDRIDSARGYVPGNVQFVHKDINLMKWSLPEDRFLSLCRAVSKYAR